MSQIIASHNINIRDFEEGDTISVAQLWYDSWNSSGLSTSDDPTVDGYRERLMGENWWMRLACVDDEILGFLAFQPDQKWVRQLFVKTSAKRKGVGTVLLEVAKREMSNGFWLRTEVENDVARRFYQSRGLRLKAEEVHPVFGHRIAVYVWP